MTTPASRNSARAARRVARYLIGEDPTSDEVARWLHGLEIAAGPLDHPRDQRLWALATGSGFALGLVDAGLALADPHSPVRQRVCLMLAILEASPAHVARFDARPIRTGGWLALGARGLGAALRAACGLVVVRSWGLLWR